MNINYAVDNFRVQRFADNEIELSLNRSLRLVYSLDADGETLNFEYFYFKRFRDEFAFEVYQMQKIKKI